MKRCAYEQNAMAAYEEMRMDSMVCPKPRRFGIPNLSLNDHMRPFRFPIKHLETGDSKEVAELDIILTKEYTAEKFCNQIAISPPFFSGSPPIRVSNPVIQDEQFDSKNINQFYQPPPPSPSSSTRKGGFVWSKYGHQQAAIRVEGFDCRDRRTCSISAVA